MQNSGESRGSPRFMISHVKISLHFMMKIAKIGYKLVNTSYGKCGYSIEKNLIRILEDPKFKMTLESYLTC